MKFENIILRSRLMVKTRDETEREKRKERERGEGERERERERERETNCEATKVLACWLASYIDNFFSLFCVYNSRVSF